MSQEPLRGVLLKATGGRLAMLRGRRLTQKALGDVVGVTHSAISFYERTGMVPEEQWPVLMRALEQAPSDPPVEDPGPELSVDELERLLEGGLIEGKELARRLGLKTNASVWQWRHRRRPIPAKYWRQIRTVFENAEPSVTPPVKPDRLGEIVLLHLLELIEEEPGLMVTEARRRLPHGYKTLRRAIALGIKEEKLYEALSPDRAWPSLFPGRAPGHNRLDNRAKGLRQVVIDLVKAAGAQGVGPKQLPAQLHVAPEHAHEALKLAIDAGEVHEGQVPYTDSMGRRRLHPRLLHRLVSESPAAADQPMGVAELSEERSRRGLTVAELAPQLAKAADVSIATATKWQNSGVPKARVPIVRALLREIPAISES